MVAFRSLWGGLGHIVPQSSSVHQPNSLNGFVSNSNFAVRMPFNVRNPLLGFG